MTGSDHITRLLFVFTLPNFHVADLESVLAVQITVIFNTLEEIAHTHKSRLSTPDLFHCAAAVYE